MAVESPHLPALPHHTSACLRGCASAERRGGIEAFSGTIVENVAGHLGREVREQSSVVVEKSCVDFDLDYYCRRFKGQG